MNPEQRREPAKRTSLERPDDHEGAVSSILRSAVFEQDEHEPELFRAHLSYGSKFLDSFVRKDKKSAGSIIEGRVDTMPRAEHETTRLYQALYALLRGLANRLGETLRYELITENERMIAWARTEGRGIFRWTGERQVDAMTGFACEISPSITEKVASKRRADQPAKMLYWESRESMN